MPTKTIVISLCDHCPHFDNEYYTYEQRCSIADRKVEEVQGYVCYIPDWCPLSDTEPNVVPQQPQPA